MILPSKKVLSILLITTALVGAIIITFGKDKSSQAINYASDLVTGDKIAVPENPNWQNELSQLPVNSNNTNTNTGSSTEETSTDTISKSLIANYLTLKQNGALDTASAQKLVDQSANLVDKLQDKVVLTTELNIIADNGVQSVTEYGENLGTILKNNRPKEIKNEMEIISEAVSTRNINKINELDSIIAVYEKIGSDMVAMPVPKLFVKAHLDMINGVKAMALALKSMKTVFSDPIKSLGAMKLYKEGVTIFTQSIQATNKFIIQNNIVYKQGSGGYYLLYGI